MLIKEWGRAKAKLLRLLDKEPTHNADFFTNGEAAFLRYVSGLPDIENYNCVIDVGANVGEWTAEAYSLLAGRGISKFFCVEPIPSFAARIEQRFSDKGNVEIIRKIFSQSPGGETEIFEIAGGGRLYQSYRGSAAAKQNAGASSKKPVPHKVAISSGDAHFADTAYRPYLLKIDCDGHDLPVLSGFAQTLQHARPIVQFEYSDFWIAAHARLRTACRLLKKCGYRTYKLFPDRLVAFEFNPLFETFGYQNIVAIPAEFESVSGSAVRLR